MPTVRQILVGLGVLALTLLVMVQFFLESEKIAAPQQREDESPPVTVSGENVEGTDIATQDAMSDSKAITILPFASELEKDLIRHDNPEASRQAVDQILFFYRKMFKENPVGQNEDIIAALLGENKERVAFIPPDSPAIKDGKIIDPWGTPYWFHAQSGQHMEIHSAGPDQELFTADDLPGTDPQQE